jgi:transcriptional regulator with XRE-family HTH domain
VTDQEQNKLGEVLRTAREARGVDLARVERDTKIRARYLTALETGDYAELPGAVYTKGFLRNYGAYLGLDPEYLVDLFRLESAQPSVERPSVPAPPRPIATRRSRPLVVTPGAILAALLTVAVAAFIIYLVAELVTFGRTPALNVTDPIGDVPAYDKMEYLIVGTTEPNSRVTVKGLTENPTVTADGNGNFEIMVSLVPGSNVITLTASDPLTGRNSEDISRTIVVGDDGPSPTPGGGAVSFSSPAEGTTVRGSVEVAGTAAPGAEVTVSARLVNAAAPTIRIVSLTGENVRLPNRSPSAPKPLTLTADGQGEFNGSLSVAPGTWDLTLTAGDDAEPIMRRVKVAVQSGLHGTLSVRGGSSYLELDEDGQPKRNASGRIAEAGTRFTLSARQSLRIRVGNAGAVRLVVNGIELGAMGDPGDVVEWRITRR